jgi:hypothetical protein
MANPNDTTTTLFVGVGGDKMDETLVTQSDNVTQAKRPRIVPGGDDGTLQTFEKFPSMTYAHVKDDMLADKIDDLIEELKLHRVLLNRIIVRMGGDYLSLPDLTAFVDE